MRALTLTPPTTTPTTTPSRATTMPTASVNAQHKLLDNAPAKIPVSEVCVADRAGKTLALHGLGAGKSAGVFAAIDLGSSSVKMLVLQATASGWTTLVDQKIGCALGKGVENGMPIPAENQERALNALKTLVALAQQYGVALADIPMVTTAVVRNASNGADFVRRVNVEAGLSPRVLSGDEEADIGYRGALGALLHTPGRYASLDLGGGSFQLAIGTEQGLQAGGSTQVGSNIILDTLINPRTDKEGRVDDALFLHIDAELHRLAPMPIDAALLSGRTLLATGGVSKFLKVQLSTDVVTRRDIDDLRRQLGSLCVAERSAFVQEHKTPTQKEALGIGTQLGALDYGKKLPASLSLLLHILDGIGVSELRVSSTDSRHALIYATQTEEPPA